MRSYLEHYGVKGMKWGVRHDKRYSKRDRVFVSGSSKTQFKDSGYFRKDLPSPVRREIDKATKAKANIIVGDAPGVDRQVQDYLNTKKYSNVSIYGPGKQVRYSANKLWSTHPIDAPEFIEGSKEWLAKKDIVMEQQATRGIAIILDEGSKATRKNVERLISSNKDVRVYELSAKGAKYDKWVL